MKVFITGSSGLIGSELVSFFDRRAGCVLGMDNNMRAEFFGPEGDTTWNLQRLRQSTRHFQHHQLDIRDREGLSRFYKDHGPFDLIVHCADRNPQYTGDDPSKLSGGCLRLHVHQQGLWGCS